MKNDGNFFVYEIDLGRGQEDCCVSLLPSEVVFATGLTTEAIVGIVPDATKIVADTFRPNGAFLRFLNTSIEANARDCADLVAEAKRVGNGTVVIADKRAPPNAPRLELKDIVAAFTVRNGDLAQFHINSQYEIFSSHGFMRLPDFFHERLLKDLIAHQHKAAT